MDADVRLRCPAGLSRVLVTDFGSQDWCARRALLRLWGEWGECAALPPHRGIARSASDVLLGWLIVVQTALGAMDKRRINKG